MNLDEAGGVVLDSALLAESEAMQETAPGDVPGVAPAGAGQSARPEKAFDWTAEARGLVDMALEIVTPFFPSLGNVYTDEVRTKVSAVAGRLFQKYNVTTPEILEKWLPEIQAAVVLVPLVRPTIEAIRADRAKAIEQKPDAVKAPGPERNQPRASGTVQASE